ncbi:DUF58 domain-containing protein [Ectothiorhodospiraceae bacterium 2226]|nr:DUF58 domain-containing protein [Ectothiorhodospiraceae bacterium 2226]
MARLAGTWARTWHRLVRAAAVDRSDRPLLSADELAALVRLAEERAPEARAGALAGGERPTHWHGQGLDFQELRRYEQGDDVRAIDWRTTARTGTAHVRVYRQERRRSLYLIVDLGASMRFGTRVRLKAAQAARLAVLLALQCTREGGAVGAAILGEKVRLWPVRTGRRHALALAELLAAPCPPLPITHGAADFDYLLAALGRQLPAGAELVLLSDFRWLGERDARALHRFAAGGRRVRAVRITDAVEHRLPAVGRAPFCALSSDVPVWLDTTQAPVRAAFEAQAQAADAACARRLAAAGAAYLSVTADLAAEALLPRLAESGAPRRYGSAG